MTKLLAISILQGIVQLMRRAGVPISCTPDVFLTWLPFPSSGQQMSEL